MAAVRGCERRAATVSPVEDHDAARAAAVVQALAALSPSSEPRPTSLTIPLKWFRWLPAFAVGLFNEPLAHDLLVELDPEYGERLAAVDQIRLGQRSIRVGWLFVAGRVADANGKLRKVFHPLVTMPVRVERPPFGAPNLLPAGDAELSDLVTDEALRDSLAHRVVFGDGALEHHADPRISRSLLDQLPDLRQYALGVAESAGLHAARVVPVTTEPEELSPRHVVVVAGCGVYAVDGPAATSRAGSLSMWASERLNIPTALHAIYLGREVADPAGGDYQPVESPFVLTPAQRAAVLRSRTAPVTVIAGAPGTGKSHTIAAIACDALARDETVLVAAKSDATVDALVDLLERTPGPAPVVFGSNERRRQLATRLADGAVAMHTEAEVRDARDRLDASAQQRDAIYRWLTQQLRAEELSSLDAHDRMDAWRRAPRLFDPALDLAEVSRLVAVSEANASGWWWRRRRGRKAGRRLSELTETPFSAEGFSTVKQTLPVAEAARQAAALASQGGLEIGRHWLALREADDRTRDLVAQWLALDAGSARRLNRSALGSVAALATALRTGRAARRKHLRRLDTGLTTALPLWIGTLADVEDLLPPIAALFDVVILDEASSVDQPLAAPALLRGHRAVVVGDPRQLRHVSFVADDHIQDVLTVSGIATDPLLAASLDVRRNSAFDVASGTAPVAVLDEHFRSDPHLVDFVAHRIYGDAVLVATRSPRTESADCVERRPVDGRRDDSGVVEAEVDAIVAELARLHEEGRCGVGVVTPFRAQADALEEAVLAHFTADALEALDVRVGTVHQFQGNERDMMLASLAIGPDDTGAPWHFVNDPHLLAVFLTRARRRLVFFHSADPPAGSLLADYLAQADSPPGRPDPVGTPSTWAATVAKDLADAGVPVVAGYPVGRHIVQLAAGDGEHAVTIDCGVHPDGPAAHIERNLALLRAGWQILDAYETRWGERRGELTLELLSVLRPQV